MTIEFNTDKTVNGHERNRNYFTSQIEGALRNYQSHIAKIEVHLSDQNGEKKGWNDILCLLEAKIDGRPAVVVSNQANTVELAVTGAIDKLKGSLGTILGRMQNHH